MTLLYPYELFQDHPSRMVAYPGNSFPLPLHVYDADMYVVSGTVDLAGVEKLMQGQNVTPCVIEMPDGTRKAVAQLWMTRYIDPNIGPYQESMVTFSGSTDGKTHTYKWTNAVSSVAPFADPECTVFADWLYLDQDFAIACGREVWGFPKVKAKLDFKTEGSGGSTRLVHTTTQLDGAPVVRVDMAVKSGIWNTVCALFLMLKGLGFATTWRLMTTCTKSSNATTPKRLHQETAPILWISWVDLYLWSATDSIEWGDSDDCSRTMRALGFQPSAVQHFPFVKMVMLPPPPRP